MHYSPLLFQMVYASKEAAGNPKSTTSHAKVEQSAELLSEAVTDLTELLEKAGGDAGLISGLFVICTTSLHITVWQV